jgi:hypothetical protein
MDVVVRTLISLIGVAIVLGALLALVSLFVARIRASRGRTSADLDNESGMGGPWVR